VVRALGRPRLVINPGPYDARMDGGQIAGLVIVEHEIDVPLDHDDPGGPTLTVFVREVRRPGDGDDRDVLLFLQGGPGGESPRPSGMGPPWLDRALRDYRVFLLDQRGTGRSTPVTAMADRSPQEQADHLALYRADAIVADAELIRTRLGIDRWSLLGQSFGGFCSLHYLSRFPGSLREVMFAGGVPPVGTPIDEVYTATFARAIELTERHYARFPGDRDRFRSLLARCEEGEIRLPHGGLLSPRQLRSIGSKLGMAGGSESIHFLLERDPSALGFGHEVAAMLPFSGHSPLYALVQEACYADGEATRWSAARVQPAAYAADPTLLTCEHLFPWHLAEDPLLAPFAETADLLAEREWPALYDVDVLAATDVPCAAAVYYDDPYVLREFSMATAELVPTLKPWITNEYLHNAIRVGGERVMDRLIAMVRGGVV
jgi:pimeloyl-ACP methyl ester carboxylesterase